MSNTFETAPIDPRSAESVAKNGLRLGLVDTSDPAALTEWMQADARGFHDGWVQKERLDVTLPLIARRRTTAVFDETAANPLSPVSTVSSWPMDLTVPGGESVPAWSISAVTVAPSHRRRGIARAMLEAELRTANSLGVPVAILTVTETTIYGRYGFGIAAATASLSIDTKRVSWNGPVPDGRVQFVTSDQLLDDGFDLVERVRLETPGQVGFSGILFERLIGLAGETETAKKLRLVRYDDVDGDPQGFAAYRITDNPADFTRQTLELDFLVAATDDAYAGLWRFLTEMDLVATLTAPLRAVDEPVLWQLSDQRAITQEIRDHLWTRILDVPAALSGRRYAGPANVILDVTDDLGFADGLFLLAIADDGTAAVSILDGEAPDDAVAIALGVGDLSSIYLGGVSAVTLVRAGRITELRPDSAVAVDRAFRSSVAPWLSIWF